MNRALNAMNGQAGWGGYWQAWGYVRQLERTYEIIDTIGISTAESQVGLTSVEETLLPESSKVADAGLRLVQDDSVVRVVFDSKLWSNTTLTNVLQDPQRYNKFLGQVQGYHANTTNRVLIEFVETQNDKITVANLATLCQRLSGAGIDTARLSLKMSLFMRRRQTCLWRECADAYLERS